MLVFGLDEKLKTVFSTDFLRDESGKLLRIYAWSSDDVRRKDGVSDININFFSSELYHFEFCGSYEDKLKTCALFAAGTPASFELLLIRG